MAALFHDVGRLCRDGVDEWESESIEIAKANLRTDKRRTGEIISILSDSDNLLHKIMKGADSVDITRTLAYNIHFNPLNISR